MSELQFYLINGLIGLLALICLNLFRSWYSGVEHQYKMYQLKEEANKTRQELTGILNSVSRYDVERLKKTVEEFGSTIALQQAIEWFREQRSVDSKRIRTLEDRVNFMWKHKEQSNDPAQT